ncbi:hypothetical protein A5481_12205 [Methylobacterium platani]|uniref:Uncharacterized protein n=1 Tax=Methylobacterium platani TaxID=427683 RepID=A0A179SAP9_9HYPH|nr:hypothetical protein A5481_12205 [Methylobacterium platani]
MSANAVLTAVATSPRSWSLWVTWLVTLMNSSASFATAKTHSLPGPSACGWRLAFRWVVASSSVRSSSALSLVVARA